MLAPADESSQMVRDPRIAVSDVVSDVVSGVVDVLVATARGAARRSGGLAAAAARLTSPALRLALRPPLVPVRLQPVRAVQLVTQPVLELWQRERPETLRALGRWTAQAFPRALDAALGQVDVEQVVSVVLDRVDVDALVADVMRHLDVEAITLAVLDQVDLTEIVMREVDLIGVTGYVVEGIDLPEIIRDSTGSVASEAMRGLRLQGVDADEVVGRIVDRVLHRRRQRRSEKAPVPLIAPADLATADLATEGP